MYILGIDENGLGLTHQSMLGPLVVSGVGFKVTDERFPFSIPFNFKNKIKVYDSKEVFKRNQKKSYIFIEQTALSFISILKKSPINNFDFDVVKEFNIKNIICNLEGLCFFQKPFVLPLWADGYSKASDLEKFLGQNSVRFIYFRYVLLCPKLLYNKNKYEQEAEAVAEIILDWQRTIDSDQYKIFCGNIKNYSKATLQNWWKEKGILLDSTKIEFITKGDTKEFVMALASILGKYIREIFIERINRYFISYDKNIPYCAGYRQNEKFDIFISRAKEICEKNNIDLTCLVRDCNF